VCWNAFSYILLHGDSGLVCDEYLLRTCYLYIHEYVSCTYKCLCDGMQRSISEVDSDELNFAPLEFRLG
jgi:hypothetical protein